MGEAFETGLPVGAEFGDHAAADEQPAHGRRVGLQLGQMLDVFAAALMRWMHME